MKECEREKDGQKHEKDEKVKMWRGGQSNKDKKRKET